MRFFFGKTSSPGSRKVHAYRLYNHLVCYPRFCKQILFYRLPNFCQYILSNEVSELKVSRDTRLFFKKHVMKKPVI